MQALGFCLGKLSYMQELAAECAGTGAHVALELTLNCMLFATSRRRNRKLLTVMVVAAAMRRACILHTHVFMYVRTYLQARQLVPADIELCQVAAALKACKVLQLVAW
jgi:hypothetical protein